MSEWPLIAVRFVLYLDLGLAFGWPLFRLYASRTEGGEGPLPIALFGAVGLLLSGLGFLLVVAAMAGTAIGGIDPELLGIIIRETPFGWAFLARMAALLLAVLAGLLVRRARVSALALGAVAGAAALGSLAWNGHAGATEGGLGALHLGADILHLWAAGVWLGALFGLLTMLMQRNSAPARLDAAHRALHGFSTIGLLVVATLLATGVVNTVVLIGDASIADAMRIRWGQLLLFKLLLFSSMLMLAAANRFRLTPRLERAIACHDTRGALQALRLSLGLEIAAAVGILALVGWLGALPTPV